MLQEQHDPEDLKERLIRRFPTIPVREIEILVSRHAADEDACVANILAQADSSGAADVSANYEQVCAFTSVRASIDRQYHLSHLFTCLMATFGLQCFARPFALSSPYQVAWKHMASQLSVSPPKFITSALWKGSYQELGNQGAEHVT